MTQRLSILLPTVVQRADLFAKLHAELQRQSDGKPVELLVACDNKEISIGKKRDNLLRAATGDYVAFVDDDDWVAPDYVDRILAAIETNPDCVGFKIECTQNGRNPRLACASMRYKQWADNVDGFFAVRTIYHKTPVRRELALKVGFQDLRYSEDKIYSNGIMKHVKTEVFVDAVLYFYRYSSKEGFMAKYGFTTARDRQRARGVKADHVRRPFQH